MDPKKGISMKYASSSIYDTMDNFHTFLREHESSICSELSAYFDKHYKSRLNAILRQCGFSSFVGLPLFLVWLIWGHWLSDGEALYPTIVLIALGFCLHWFTKFTITVSMEDSFRHHEYHTVLHSYVDQCRNEALAKSSSEAELYDINTFFDYCSKQIVYERFEFRAKKKSPR